MHKTLLPAAAFTLTASLALAEVPQVATDIAPVHGLAARVMDGIGEPHLVVPPGASPHGHSMRPSEARALAGADAVFWIGDALTPWLESHIENLSGKAHVVELLGASSTLGLEFRETTVFGDGGHDDHGHHDDHGDEHAEHDDHDGHEDHDDHDEEHAEGHDDHDGHDDEHAEGHDDHGDHAGHDHGGHAHEGIDPHAWLHPENAKAWMALIAQELAELDPENAAAYLANAKAGQAEIDAAAAQTAEKVAGMKGRDFIVFHDAYQYFEAAFGLEVLGAISLGDAARPSPAQLAEIRDAAKEGDVACVFAEPQFNPGLVATVAEGTGAGTAVLDPLGTGIETGPQFYPQLLVSLGDAVAACQ